MADPNILAELVPGFPDTNPSAYDRERALSVALRALIDVHSYRDFAHIRGVEHTTVPKEGAEKMAQVVAIAGALDEAMPDLDGLPYLDVLDSIARGGDDPRTNSPFEPVSTSLVENA